MSCSQIPCHISFDLKWQSLRLRIVNQQCHQIWHSPFEVIVGYGSAVNGFLGKSTIGYSLCGILHCCGLVCMHMSVMLSYVNKQALALQRIPLREVAIHYCLATSLMPLAFTLCPNCHKQLSSMPCHCFWHEAICRP